MEARVNTKLKLLYIIDILQKHSDEDNPVNAAEICEKLASVGISAERKSVYNDIDVLITFGYDIIKTRVPKFGYFLASRDFELPEIYLLADAVRSADFITPKKTRELIGKLDSLLSNSQARKREKGIYMDSRRKCKNEEIYYNIDKISTAISREVKVSLKYCRHVLAEGKTITYSEKQLTVSPYAMLWENDHYYVVCNNEKYDNLMHLRLDRIKNVNVLDVPFRHFSEVCSYTNRFDVADYTEKTFNMFGGESATVEFKCKKEKLEQIIDRFSDEIFIFKVTDTTFNFTTQAMLSEGLISWLLQFGTDVEVVAPASLREEVKNRIKKIGELYN